jgi:hypothetical protein
LVGLFSKRELVSKVRLDSGNGILLKTTVRQHCRHVRELEAPGCLRGKQVG